MIYSSSTSLGSLYSLAKYSFYLLRTSVDSVRTLSSSPLTRDVNKDLTPKDKDLTPKDKDLTPKDQDKDKDLKRP